MVYFFCFFLLFIEFTIVENKGSGHSGHSGHIVHGSSRFKHVGENVQQRLSSLKGKLQDVIASIKEKAAGNEQTPQEVSLYLQKGAESGLFKTIKKTVSDIIGSFRNPSPEKNDNKNVTIIGEIVGKTIASSNISDVYLKKQSV